jgi:hypothetical protein
MTSPKPSTWELSHAECRYVEKCFAFEALLQRFRNRSDLRWSAYRPDEPTMRKIIFFAFVVGVGLTTFYWAEPQPTSDILSSVNSAAAMVVAWFDD